MTKSVKKLSPVAVVAELKELFGPAPVLTSEDEKAYDTIMLRFLENLNASDCIEQMLCRDLADASWEMGRYSRHKVLVIDHQIHEQHEMEELQEPEEAEQLEETAQGSGQADEGAEAGEQIERGEQVEQAGAPPTQFERWVELEKNVDTVVSDCDEIIAGPQDEVKAALALEVRIEHYERLDRLYSIAFARREKVLNQLDLYRQGLGSHLRRVSDEIIDGEFSEAKPTAPSIAGPDEDPQ